MRGTVFTALAIFFGLTVLVICWMVVLIRRSSRNPPQDR